MGAASRSRTPGRDAPFGGARAGQSRPAVVSRAASWVSGRSSTTASTTTSTSRRQARRGRLAAHRRADARRSWPPTNRSCARSGASNKRSNTTRKPTTIRTNARSSKGWPTTRQISFYRTGSDWVDLCRGPHVEDSSADRRVQAAQRLGRLLARRRAAADAAAHLRHGVGRRRAARALPVADRRSAQARPSQAGPRAGAVLLRRGRAGPAVLAAEGAAHHPRAGGAAEARAGQAQATWTSARRRWSSPTCGSSPGTGTSTSTACSSCRSRKRTTPTSR